jgi:hypothetical protein
MEPKTIGVSLLGESRGVNLEIRESLASEYDKARNMTPEGYTTRRGIPVDFEVRIGGRWYRPRFVCYSNAGSTFIRSPRFVGTLVLSTFLALRASSAEEIAAWEARIIKGNKA